MLTEKSIRCAISEASGKGKVVELRDVGHRGAGRLVLRIKPAAGGHMKAIWFASTQRKDKRAMVKIGEFPAMSLGEARHKFHVEASPTIRAGEPIGRKRAANGGGAGKTIEEMFRAYVASLRAAGKPGAKDAAYSLLGSKVEGKPIGGVAKALGPHRPVAKVTSDDIVEILRGLNARGPTLAQNTRAILNAAFSWAMGGRYSFFGNAGGGSDWGLKDNPVAIIPTNPDASRPGERYLDPGELRVFWTWLWKARERRHLASALLLRITTGARGIDILRIDGDIYDRKNRALFWTSTKSGAPLAVPVGRHTAAILDDIVPAPSGLFFPNWRDQTRPATFAGVLKVVGEFLAKHPEVAPLTSRDLRRTTKSLMGHAGISKDMRDALMAHGKGDDVSARHYDRWSRWNEKVAAIKTFDDYIDRVLAGEITDFGESNVIQLKTAAARK
jgi:integrase